MNWSLIDIVLIAATAITAYVLCYGVDFLWKLLVVAPAVIDKEHRREATQLRQRLERPPRTAGEEQRYQQAKSALADLSSEAAQVLRHLIVHGEVMFTLTIGGGANQLFAQGPLPAGMDARNAHTLLNQCSGKNLVTQRTIQRDVGAVYPVSDETYQIAPGMKTALDELLYGG